MRSSKCSSRERAAFEAGIKLGALYHQYIGTPVGPESAGSLEKAMSESMMVQPFVKKAVVTIDRKVLNESLSSFGYASLSERMVKAEVEIEVDDAFVGASLQWIEEMEYPLMRLDEIV
ncbi:MAG: dihydroneopterin aldolase family protein [Candidatus Thermoplasmatota archaeon]|nr:dihydroneopterin aldolase family protein [Candidatus Thermoplasmatota archaeon]